MTKVGYGKIHAPAPQESEKGLGITGVDLEVAVIGYIIKEVDKAVTKARTGDYGAKAQDVSGLDFSGGGYLLVLHTVKTSPKLGKVATLKDFLSNQPGTAGNTLRTQMAAESVAGADVDKAVQRLVTQKQIDEGDHIALLVVCPVKQLPDRKLYAVSLDGLYFPVISARRFKGESSHVVQRLAKENESMTLEIYGSKGYNYTTGTINVPLAWFPPQGTGHAQWLGRNKVNDELKTDGNQAAQKQLEQLLSNDTAAALAAHRDVAAPTPADQAVLRADAHVSETSQATGWIVKGIDKLGGLLTSAVKK